MRPAGAAAEVPGTNETKERDDDRDTGQAPRGHTGRVAAVGLAVGALVLLGFGGAAAVDATAGDGYVSLGAGGTYDTSGYALTTDSTNWHAGLSRLVGRVRIRVESNDRPIFAGVAEPAVVQGLLAGARYTTVHNGNTRTEHDGAALRSVAAVPWTTSATGSGTRTLEFPATAGEQTLVVTNADGSPSVRGRVESVAVTIRGIGWIAAGLLAAGALLLATAIIRIRPGVRAR